MVLRGELANDAFKAWFDKTCAFIIKRASKIIFDDQDEHAPMLFLFSRNERQAPKTMLLDMSPEGKDQSALLHRLAGQTGTSVLVSETWTLTGDDAEANKGESIADHPNRTEAFMLSAIRGSMQLLAMYPIDRVNNCFGKRSLIDPMTVPHARSAGRMILNSPKEDDET